MLLDRDAHVELRDELSRTALFETLGCHDLNGAHLLLDYGINISSCGHEGNTLDNESNSALSLAAKAGHASTVELLMEYGADHQASKWESETSSQKTTEASNRPIRQLLHDHDEGVDATRRQ